MKRTLLAALALALLAAPALGQWTGTPAKTGDRALDSALETIAKEARTDPDGWVKTVSLRHAIPEADLRVARDTHRLEPADVFMASALAHLTGRPVLTVAETYRRNEGKGWGVVAREMGIRPGSPQFHELKKGARGSADRLKAAAKERHRMAKQAEKQKGKPEGKEEPR